ncbi:MAG TPA: glycosyltransferase [Thermoanaerobaculia bacterium]|nr:glycosyltransferase [Thermoanaerobaculia bacterium]
MSAGASAPDVSIVVVSYGSGADLPVSLGAAAAQAGVSTELLVVENGDPSASRGAAEAAGARFLPQPENRGFAGGANAGIAAASGRYVLTLNPDCRLDPGFCAALVRRMDADPECGSASGRILRGEGDTLAPSGVVDSTGIVFTASGRHFDRDSGAPDTPAVAGRAGPIAGVTGAAGFYRRTALDSVRISTGWFDEDFFVYREDADLALRLRAAGWRCVYVPEAVAWHRRTNLPDRRRKMTAAANRHSVKNRFLLRINNAPVPEFRPVPTLARDVVVVVGCLVSEWASLPAFGWLIRHRRRLLAKRAEIAAIVERARSAGSAREPAARLEPAPPRSGTSA